MFRAIYSTSALAQLQFALCFMERVEYIPLLSEAFAVLNFTDAPGHEMIDPVITATKVGLKVLVDYRRVIDRTKAKERAIHGIWHMLKNAPNLVRLERRMFLAALVPVLLEKVVKNIQKFIQLPTWLDFLILNLDHAFKKIPIKQNFPIPFWTRAAKARAFLKK